MRRYDAYTIEHFVPGKELMYRAAMGVYESYDEWNGKKIAILAGGGNNGGDGYALAGILKKNGHDSHVFKVSEKMSEDGKYYHDIAEELGVEISEFVIRTTDDAQPENTTHIADISSYDVIVDCILGTGFTGEVRGNAKAAIEAINGSSAYVISVDINSGMNGDTGEGTTVVRSNITVSIGFIKQGLVTDEAKKYIKRLVNADIGIVAEE